MQIGITGHTHGIGKSIFEKFFEEGHEIVGFARSNGFNISNLKTLHVIVNKCKNFDIFINNAYHATNQLYLLKLFYEKWKNTNKIIVNVSSRYTSDSNEYSISKKKQDEFCRSLIYTTPLILNIKPGLTDTDRVKSFQGSRMLPTDVANIIYNSVFSKIKIHEITFGL